MKRTSDNPSLRLADLGVDVAPMDIADGKDEDMLRADIHPIYDWSVDRDGDDTTFLLEGGRYQGGNLRREEIYEADGR